MFALAVRGGQPSNLHVSPKTATGTGNQKPIVMRAAVWLPPPPFPIVLLKACPITPFGVRDIYWRERVRAVSSTATEPVLQIIAVTIRPDNHISYVMAKPDRLIRCCAPVFVIVVCGVTQSSVE